MKIKSLVLPGFTMFASLLPSLRSNFQTTVFALAILTTGVGAGAATPSSVYNWNSSASGLEFNSNSSVKTAQSATSLGEILGVSTTGYYTDLVYFACRKVLTADSDLRCNWIFGDGTSAENIQFPNHKYPGAGRYTVAVTICDTLANECGELSQTFVLVEPPSNVGYTLCTPNMNLGGPYSGYPGESIPFLAADSGCTGVTYKWSYGDGTVVTNSKQGNKGRYSPHVYTLPGTYPVLVSVEVCHFLGCWAGSQTTEASTTVTILQPPVAPVIGVALGVGVNFHNSTHDTFVVGNDGNLWRAYLAGTTWIYENIGRPSAGIGIVSSIGDNFRTAGTVENFVMGSDGNLWRAHSTLGSPWAFQNLGKPNAGVSIVGSVGVANLAGYVNVFLIGSDGNLWRTYSNGSPWVYENLGTAVSDARVARGVGVIVHAGYLDVFLLGTDGNLWRTYSNGSAWTFQNLGTPSADVQFVDKVGVLNHDGYLDIVLIGSDNNIWRTYSNGSPWVYQNVGRPSNTVGIARSVGVAYRPGFVDIFTLGDDGNLWRSYSNGSPWIHQNLGTPSAAVGIDDGFEVIYSANQLTVYLKGRDNSLWRTYSSGSSSWIYQKIY